MSTGETIKNLIRWLTCYARTGTDLLL